MRRLRWREIWSHARMASDIVGGDVLIVSSPLCCRDASSDDAVQEQVKSPAGSSRRATALQRGARGDTSSSSHFSGLKRRFCQPWPQAREGVRENLGTLGAVHRILSITGLGDSIELGILGSRACTQSAKSVKSAETRPIAAIYNVLKYEQKYG